MPNKIRLGTCSPATQSTTAETLSLLSQITERAAAQKIDILLLPEAFIGGYPRGTHFGCVIGNRTAEGRDEYLRYFQTAVDLGDTVGNGAGAGAAWLKRELDSDGAATKGENGEGWKRGDGTREELERIARESGVFVVVGLIEKTGGSLYCSVVYVCPKLGIIGKRRKVQPTGTERLCWAAGSTATLRAVSTVIRGVRINLAAAICWENYMPMLRQALYAQNINLYLAPTADGRDSWLSLLRTVGVEGRCFVVSSNMCTKPKAPTEGTNSRTLNGRNTSQDDELQNLRRSIEGTPRHRRNSAITEDGFEVALPSPVLGQSRSPQRRRKSVFDNDGNEIVLCDGENKDEQPVIREENGGNETGTREDRSPVVQTGARSRSRRKSVIDENGNQIVLCCDENKEKTPPTSGKKEQPKSALHATTELRSRGGSSIVSPFGDVLAGPQWEDDAGLIYTDVDFEDCIRGRLDLDVGGSYARNDSFKFSVQGLDLSPLPY